VNSSRRSNETEGPPDTHITGHVVWSGVKMRATRIEIDTQGPREEGCGRASEESQENSEVDRCKEGFIFSVGPDKEDMR